MMQVTQVRYEGGYRLALSFSDGSSGVADLEAELHGPFASLRDWREFARAHLDGGTVCWPGDLDLAPERLYALTHKLPIPDSFEDVEANEMTVTLRELRKISGKTQVEVADELGIAQSELSRFERRDDIRLGTLRRYVEALGGRLALVAEIGDKRVVIRG